MDQYPIETGGTEQKRNFDNRTLGGLLLVKAVVFADTAIEYVADCLGIQPAIAAPLANRFDLLDTIKFYRKEE